MSGAAWLESNGKVLSALGADVAGILGNVFAGIYHIDREVLHPRVKWDHERVIAVVIGGELATHDGDELARLVVLTAQRGIRLAISGRAPGYLRLQFTRGAGMFMGKMRTPQQMVDDYTLAVSTQRGAA
jgi:hypothetical protein